MLLYAMTKTLSRAATIMSHINTSAGDLLNKLEATRLVCQETGCAQRYLTHDALNAIGHKYATFEIVWKPKPLVADGSIGSRFGSEKVDDFAAVLRNYYKAHVGSLSEFLAHLQRTSDQLAEHVNGFEDRLRAGAPRRPWARNARARAW